MTVIYDPAAPPLIFDGLLDVYSTCRDCGELMKVITPDQHSHPCCATVQTQLESLADLWLSEVRAGADDRANETEELIESMRNIELGAAAYDYATWDWPVFPLGKRAKEPAIKGGTGFKQATADPARIERWWTRHPEHNIGLATGHAFDVIDIDTKDNKGNPSPVGVQSFTEVLQGGKLRKHNNRCNRDNTCRLQDCPPFKIHAVAVTASGGIHLYMNPTGKGCTAGLRPGIDYRGKGGYVVAPPSLLRAPGRAYTWLVEPSPIIKGGF